MLTPLLIGSLTIVFTMVIQVSAVVFMLRYLLKLVSNPERKYDSWGFDTYVITVVLLVLFIGHLFQVAVWATVFLYLGEFEEFRTAFYHSMVNFAALGYGDIVMSERWRLLGALESSIGVLMFGLTAGIMFAVMSPLFTRHIPTSEQIRRMQRK